LKYLFSTPATPVGVASVDYSSRSIIKYYCGSLNFTWSASTELYKLRRSSRSTTPPSMVLWFDRLSIVLRSDAYNVPPDCGRQFQKERTCVAHVPMSLTCPYRYSCMKKTDCSVCCDIRFSHFFPTPSRHAVSCLVKSIIVFPARRSSSGVDGVSSPSFHYRTT
jgi:hypothetical protein